MTSPLHILVTGAGGQLGRKLQDQSKHYPQWRFHFAAREALDVTQEKAVQAYFARHPINACIHCAAYTAVDKAESESAAAHAVNVQGTEHIAQACAKHGTPLLHYSTDFVFDGAKNTPYHEDDHITPLGVYGKTKAESEKRVLQHQSKSIILRTSWVYSEYGHNFLKTMLHLGTKKEAINVVYDQVGTPTYAGDLARDSLRLLKQVLDQKDFNGRGIYHYSNEGVASWYDFACAIMAEAKLNCRVLPVETHEFPTAAKRPAYSVLHKGRIKKAFGLDIPYWRDSLHTCLRKIQSS